MGIWDMILHPIRHLKNVRDLYDDLICTQLIKHSSRECLNKRTGRDEVCVDFNGMYDHANISYFYVVSEYPQELQLDFKSLIRRECRGGVRISFFNVIYAHKMNWYSPAMKSKLRVMRLNSEEQAEKNVTVYNLHDNILNMSRQGYIESSLSYLVDADLKRGRQLVSTSMMMTISGQRGDDFDDTVKAVEEFCEHINLGIERVNYDVPDVVGYYSPFRNQNIGGRVSSVPIHVMTDEIVARFATYGQGILGVGGKRATYFGTDIYSGFPILKMTKSDTESAEVWLCTAETGGGKSFYVKCLILQLLALNMRGTIMDVEGTEYLSLARFCSNSSKVVVLNMAEGVGKYFDPVEISEPTGIEDIDRDAKNMSINFTNSVLKVLLGRAYQENTWLSVVVNEAVSATYIRHGVTDDAETWGLSKGMTLRSVFDTLRIFSSYYKLQTKEQREKLADKYHVKFTDYMDNEEYELAVEQAVAFISPYFAKDGLRSALFEHRVLVSDIADADLVVCSFGMAGKSTHAIDEVQLSLMQLSAAQISHQRSIFSKAKGKFNFKIWEEFQRWGKFPDSDKTIGVAVTGGRKLGDINIVITNVVKDLLDDDRFGIFSNKTSFMIGAITDSQVREELATRLSIPNMLPELNRIATAARGTDEFKNSSNSSNSVYRFSFLVGLDSSKYGIAKMLIPREMAKSDLFRTGITEADGGTDDGDEKQG